MMLTHSRSLAALFFVLSAAAAGAGLAGSVGCNAILETDSYSFRACNGDGGACPISCSVASDCFGAFGDKSICRADKTCAPLLSDRCKDVIGNYADPGAIVFGALVTLTGDNRLMGIAEVTALRTAMTEFQNATTGSLPPAGGSQSRRPIAIVYCDDEAKVDPAVAAASHLVNTVRVPAIIGSQYSGVSINVANRVTIPGGVALISPGATSPNISELPDNGLVWRTVAAANLEAPAMAKVINDIETDIRAKMPLQPADPIRVVILNKGDAYGQGYQRIMAEVVTFNGKKGADPANQPYFATVDFGDPSSTTTNPVDYPRAVQQVLNARPHVISVHATSEVLENVLLPVEARWDNAWGYRPRWLLDHSQFGSKLGEVLQKNDPSGALRKRIVGTLAATQSATWAQFRLSYADVAGKTGVTAPPETFGAPNTYDAFYVLLYATASLGAMPVTGPGLVSQFPRFSPPLQTFPVGLASINTVLNRVVAGQFVNLEGASGPLDFDPVTGNIASAEFLVWCYPPPPTDGRPWGPLMTSFHFDAAGNRVGKFSDVPAACGF